MPSENKVVAVLLCGGIGIRLYPISTRENPKQFRDLLGTGRSMLQATVDRISPIVDEVLVVTNEAQKPLVEQQLPDAEIALEPEGMNSASAIHIAAVALARSYGADTTMIVLPCDHHITMPKKMLPALIAAIEVAKSAKLVTIGIPTTKAHTGYGYLACHTVPANFTNTSVAVLQFHEKPDARTAATYHADPCYFWNSGMFVWTAGSILAAIQQFMPANYEKIEEVAEWASSGKTFYWTLFFENLQQALSTLEGSSIDFDVMEKAANTGDVAMIIPEDFGWDDIGSFATLSEYWEKDLDGNRIASNSNVLLTDCKGCWVFNDGDMLVRHNLVNYLIVNCGGHSLEIPLFKLHEIGNISRKAQRLE